jgi:osmotically-inducible protein OsmY
MDNRDQEKERRRYNAPSYYENNRRLGEERSRTLRDINQTDNYATEGYDDLNTGKYENYQGNGYYGSSYGSMNTVNAGRDYEQNAGYRDNYNRLTTGQWPEVERANESRRGTHQPDGKHRGKGPRSYQRSDVRIREDVNDALTEDRYLDASDIEVTVQNGEVILSGTVDDRNAKRRAEDIAEQLSGVKHLENRLRTRRSGGQTINIQNHAD